MVVLLPILLGLPVASDAEKVTAKLFVPDALTRPDRSVKLEARLVQAGLFAQAGLGGEQIEFLVGGKKVGTALTGGDGRAFLEYTPRMRGNLSLVVRVVESPRVASVERIGRSRNVVFVGTPPADSPRRSRIADGRDEDPYCADSPTVARKDTCPTVDLRTGCCQ
jgi:hypothetical protein